MNERIVLLTAHPSSYKNDIYFPFIEGTLSPLPNESIAFLQSLSIPIQNYTLRTAKPTDAPYIYPLLYAYGDAANNYGDLEQIKATSQTHNTLARWSILSGIVTFLLMDRENPIGFLLMELYHPQDLPQLFKQYVFPRWDAFFQTPLSCDLTTDLSVSLHHQFLPAAFATFCDTHHLKADAEALLAYIEQSLRTLTYIQEHIKPHQWIANMAYGLLPDYQRKGLMSAILRSLEIIALRLSIVYLFSDRVACDNVASIALLKRNGFTQGGMFTAYYGPDYTTHLHPQGNFSEPCASFYKTLYP
ncbi:MAG: GNAT family N-acetyltransferase [Opitutales bacterium]|nr:GNAT family N-acetyltransferase [Opitutales bacterium]